jgi:biotin synthase
MLRFFLPDRNLMAAGGKEITLGDRLHEVFAVGANAVMVGNYLTTMGTAPEYWQDAAKRWGLKLGTQVEEIEPAPTSGGKSCGTNDCGCA